MADIEVRAGDTLPQFDVTITENGQPVDLSDADVRLRVYGEGDSIVVNGPCQIDPNTKGRVIRPWGNGETDRPGTYRADVLVTKVEGRRTYPTDAYFSIEFSVPTPARRTGVDPDVVAAEYGLTPLTADQRTRLIARLAEVLGQMEGRLNRRLTPAEYEETTTGNINAPATWGTSEPIRRILGAVDLGNGRLQVRYLGGLDAEQDEDLRAFLTAHAVLRWYNTAPPRERLVLSMTVEGQSKTYMNTQGVAAGAPGGPPEWSTITHYQRLQIAGGVRQYDPFVEQAMNGGGHRYHWIGEYGIGAGAPDADLAPDWGGNEYGQQDEWPGFQS